MRRKDLIGSKYGRLTVIAYLGIKNKKSNWHCKCSCGKLVERYGAELTRARTERKSCGCWVKEINIKSFSTHGKSFSPEYRAWTDLRHRCLNPKNKGWKNYGARGITVCDRWELFKNFYTDMGPRPSALHSIDRIDTNGDYCPENCRWATDEVQHNNKRVTRHIEFEGKVLSVAQWARHIGLTPNGLWRRLRLGWPLETALSPNSKFKHLKSRA